MDGSGPTPRPARRNLYLSSSVWGEMKRRATLEGSDASGLAEYVLAAYLAEPDRLALPRRRQYSRNEMEILKTRTVYLSDLTWAGLQRAADEEGFSISGLAETLLRRYLGMPASPDLQARPG